MRFALWLWGNIISMGKGETPGDRLKKLREADRRNFGSAAEAARAMGVNPVTYQAHENNTRGLRRGPAAKYAKFYGTTLDYLLSARNVRNPTLVPVVGYIGPGQELQLLSGTPASQVLDLVEPPTGEDGPCLAARIQGNSMHPMKDGWIIFWNKDDKGVPESSIGQLCVVTLPDGRQLVKELYRGSRAGLYNLASWNAPMIVDVAVATAARVIAIRTV
jgi:transcriptional regulator with XRE-family HTH domain